MWLGGTPRCDVTDSDTSRMSDGTARHRVFHMHDCQGSVFHMPIAYACELAKRLMCKDGLRLRAALPPGHRGGQGGVRPTSCAPQPAALRPGCHTTF